MLFLYIFLAVFITVIAVVLLRDFYQKKNAITRNFPVIGRMRNLLIKLGPLIRQYFIASNRTCGYEHPSQMKMVDVDVSCGDNNKVIILEAAYGYEKPEIPFSSMQELLECKYLSGLGKEKNRLIKKH